MAESSSSRQGRLLGQATFTRQFSASSPDLTKVKIKTHVRSLCDRIMSLPSTADRRWLIHRKVQPNDGQVFQVGNIREYVRMC